MIAGGPARPVLLGCSMGGVGHLVPVLDAARELAQRGDRPTVLVAPSLADRARATCGPGVEIAVGAQPPQAEVDAIWDRVRAGPPQRVTGLIDRELFAGTACDAMRAAAHDACGRLAPRLVVREPCEYATAMAAHRAGIPVATIGISQARIEHGVLAAVGSSLDARCPGVAEVIAAAPYLTAFPASLDPSPWADTRRYRVTAPAPTRPLPDWWPGAEHAPLVYVTFGSVLGHLSEARHTFAAVLRAVDGLPVRALLTVGTAVDPATLGPLPGNVHAERWVAQADALAGAALVVCHGGSGTALGALGAGLPLVVCPLFADQGANGRVIEAAGAGVVVTPERPAGGGLATLHPRDAPGIRAGITRALGDRELRDGARRVRDELAAAPLLGDALSALGPGGDVTRDG